MNVSLSDAKARLTDLVRRAEGGEEIVLTRHGRPAVRLTPLQPLADDVQARLSALEAISREAAAVIKPGPSAARSQDFLYDEDGLPA